MAPGGRNKELVDANLNYVMRSAKKKKKKRKHVVSAVLGMASELPKTVLS